MRRNVGWAHAWLQRYAEEDKNFATKHGKFEATKQARYIQVSTNGTSNQMGMELLCQKFFTVILFMFLLKKMASIVLTGHFSRTTSTGEGDRPLPRQPPALTS